MVWATLEPIDEWASRIFFNQKCVTRKDADLSDWHFREDCPLWPKLNDVEVHAPILDD